MADEASSEVEWVEAEVERLYKAYRSDNAPPGDLVPGQEYLHNAAGRRSSFSVQADALVKDATAWSCSRNALLAHSMADLLLRWLEYREAGITPTESFEVRAREEAATDLMEQVQQLLDDRKVHPAAPVMLAGAALEEALRAMVAKNGLTPNGKPGIETYANALRTAEVITTQQRKDITSIAGFRNDAAHGTFEAIELPHARLVALQVNLLLTTLSKDV